MLRRSAGALSRSLARWRARSGAKAHSSLCRKRWYLTNNKTLDVRTFITRSDGRYRFDSLSPNVDYDVFVIYNGKRSATKTLSSFDSRSIAYLDFKFDVPAGGAASPSPSR